METRSAEDTTVAPALRTISMTPAGTRSRYGTASPGEYSMATCLPFTSAARWDSRARQLLYCSLRHFAGQDFHGPCSIAWVMVTGVPPRTSDEPTRRTLAPRYFSPAFLTCRHASGLAMKPGMM